MFILNVIDVLNNAGRAVSGLVNFFSGRGSSGNPSSGSSLPSSGRDSFGRIPLIDDIKQHSSGALSGVRAILQAVRSAYRAGVGNSSPMFRFALAAWAIGMIHQAASTVQGILESTAEGDRDTPEYREAQALKGSVFTAQSLIGTFTNEQKENIQGNQRLAKSMNDVAKMA